MDTLLPWQQKQVLITLLLEGIRTSYLMHTFLEVTAISGISCCHGYLVTMTTEAGICNITVGRYKNFKVFHIFNSIIWVQFYSPGASIIMGLHYYHIMLDLCEMNSVFEGIC